MEKKHELVEIDTDIQLRQHYVYILIDPSADDPWNGIFYVGKGQGDRLNAHDDDGSTTKNERIKQIGNDRVIRRVVGSYSTAAEAFAVEAVLIDFVFGRSSVNAGHQLTNIQSGHNHRYVRPRGNYDRLENLDISRRIGERVPGYLRRRFEALVRNEIPVLAEDVIEQLNLRMDNRGLTGVVLPIDNPSKKENGRFWGADVHFEDEANIILRIQFSPKSVQTPIRARDEATTVGRDVFSARISKLNKQYDDNNKIEIKNRRYAWLINVY
jgi:hypothetical protein